MQTVLVTGATGCIGRALVRKLLRHDLRIRVLVRDPGAFDRLFPHSDGAADVICGDLGDFEALERAVKGVDTVYHLAAKVHTRAYSEEDKRAFFEINVEHTRRLLRACKSAPLTTFVFFSTIAVYGPQAPPFDERTECTPDTPYGASKYQAEQVIAAHFAGSRVMPTVLRLAKVFGEGDRGNFVRMVRAIDRGRFVSTGPDVPKSFAYAENVAAAAILAATDEHSRGEVFVVADTPPYTVRQLATSIARVLGKREPRIHLPAWPLYGAGTILRRLHSTVGVSVPFTDADIKALTRSTVCDTSKLRQFLRYQPNTAMEDGIVRTVAWYQSRCTDQPLS